MKQKKMLYFDVETTGLDPQKHDIIQLSGLIEYDGKVVDGFNYRIRPQNFEAINQEALDVNGITVDQLKEFPEAGEIYFNFIKIMETHINRYDKNDKFIPVAYNGKFDMDFLAAFFAKNEDKYLGSWLSWNLIDPMAVARFYFILNDQPLTNYKLETVCEHFGIPLNAHDAMNDIVATREVLNRLMELTGINKSQVNQ
jgi:DNA polymerase-3 subunit epsilon